MFFEDCTVRLISYRFRTCCVKLTRERVCSYCVNRWFVHQYWAYGLCIYCLSRWFVHVLSRCAAFGLLQCTEYYAQAFTGFESGHIRHYLQPETRYVLYRHSYERTKRFPPLFCCITWPTWRGCSTIISLWSSEPQALTPVDQSCNYDMSDAIYDMTTVINHS